VIRKNSIRTEHVCNQQLSKPGAKLRLEAIQNVTMLHRAEKASARSFYGHTGYQNPKKTPNWPNSVIRHGQLQALKRLFVDTPELSIMILHHLRKEINRFGGDQKARNFSDIANSYALRAGSD